MMHGALIVELEAVVGHDGDAGLAGQGTLGTEQVEFQIGMAKRGIAGIEGVTQWSWM